MPRAIRIRAIRERALTPRTEELEASYKSYREGSASGFADTRSQRWPNSVVQELFHIPPGIAVLLDSVLVRRFYRRFRDYSAPFSVFLSSDSAENSHEITKRCHCISLNKQNILMRAQFDKTLHFYCHIPNL